LSLLFCDGDDGELASGRNTSPALARRGKSWIVVVVVMVRLVIPDLTDAVSETLPPPPAAVNTGDVDVDADVNADADTDDFTTLGDPSA
jgi:hypothetical protein